MDFGRSNRTSNENAAPILEQQLVNMPDGLHERLVEDT